MEENEIVQPSERPNEQRRNEYNTTENNKGKRKIQENRSLNKHMPHSNKDSSTSVYGLGIEKQKTVDSAN